MAVRPTEEAMPNTPPPQQRPQSVSLTVKRLKIVIPVAAIVALAILLTPGLAYLVLPGGQAPQAAPEAPEAPGVPLLAATPSPLPHLGAVLPGKIPRPGPNQLRANKCDKRAAQVAINGGCWVKTDTPPPCPVGFQWEHDGKCWLPVAEAKPVPTTGEPRTAPLANPPSE